VLERLQCCVADARRPSSAPQQQQQRFDPRDCRLQSLGMGATLTYLYRSVHPLFCSTMSAAKFFSSSMYCLSYLDTDSNRCGFYRPSASSLVFRRCWFDDRKYGAGTISALEDKVTVHQSRSYFERKIWIFLDLSGLPKNLSFSNQFFVSVQNATELISKSPVDGIPSRIG